MPYYESDSAYESCASEGSNSSDDSDDSGRHAGVYARVGIEPRVDHRAARIPPVTRGVYALEDAYGRVYIGKSEDVERRVRQHMTGKGTSFLHTDSIHQVNTITLGPKNDLESWERNETLTQMFRCGMNRVRGWLFSMKELGHAEKEQAFAQVCHKFDLCLKCGRKSHFADKCFARSRADWAVMD